MGGSVYSSSGISKLEGIMVENLGLKKKGDEYLSIPISKTRCLVAFNLKLVARLRVSPRLTTILSASGFTDLYTPLYST